MVGIYKIRNTITNEVYIGQSTDIKARWANHRKNATAKAIVRKYALYRDMRRYGIVNFEFSVIEECTKFQLNDRENFWIRHYSLLGKIYNILVPEGATRR